jgi:hypothetical protein
MRNSVLVLLCQLFAATAVHADVTSYTLERHNFFNQEPNGSGYFISSEFSVTVETTAAGDFDSVAVAGPPPADVQAPLVKTGGVHELLAAFGAVPKKP